MSEIRQVLAACWSELRSIESRMTKDEKEWFRNFLRAYYLGIRSAAAQIAPTRDAYFSVLATVSPRREIVSRLRRQNGYIYCTWVSVEVTVRPKTTERPSSRLEEILVEYLDEKRFGCKKVKPTPQSGPRKRFSSAQFSALEMRILEIHYKLTPW